jgi:hypothetical protein
MNGSTVRVSGLWLTEVGLKPARAAIKSRATSGKSGVKSIRGTKTPKARYTRVVKVL